MKIEVFVSTEKNPDFISKCLMFFLRVNYSHIGFIINDYWVWHHIEKGICKDPLAQFLIEHEIQRKDITRFLRKSPDYMSGYFDGSRGKEYSFTQYLGVIFKPMRALVKNGRSKGFCSEFVARFLDDCTNVSLPNDGRDWLKPTQVWESIE